MKRWEKWGIGIAVVLILLGVGIYFGYRTYQVKHAKVEVTLVDDLFVEVGSKAKMSDFIVSMNGTLEEDEVIDTSKLGAQKFDFSYRNDDHIRVSYSFEIEVVDHTAPIAWLGSSYTVNVGASSDFSHNIMCADNFDANPVCEVVGEYDLNTVGSYPVIFQAVDESGNRLEQPFTLNVVEPKKGGSSSSNPTKTIFSEVVRDYKTENTEIGLDISFWQGDVDYHALKENGVEFVFLRVGTTKGIGGEYILDKKFVQNIERATEVGIPVGIYFYSYANSEEQAIQDAKWVLEQIQGYKIALPIAFDWENWSFYNDFHLSLLGLSDAASGFIQTVEDAGYEGMLYSSKNYLEKVWPEHDHTVWLAHYTSKTNYQGDYDYWQMCSDGIISGINGYVDIDVRYKKS